MPIRLLAVFAPYLHGGLIVAGQRVAAQQCIQLVDKYTLQPCVDVPAAEPQHIREAFEAAHEAREAMRSVPLYARKRMLLDLASRLEARKEDFALALVVEVGKPLAEARTEVERAIDTLTLSAEEATRQYGEAGSLETSARNAGFSYISRRFPIGVVSMITPFNFPVNLAAHKIGPAIAAGCPFVLKPSPQTPLTALMLGTLLQEIGLHAAAPGAFSILPSADAHAALFSEHPAIACVSFTGSPLVGWRIKNNAKGGRARAHLELGGNAACIVDRGADVAHAARRVAAGAFSNAGQSCISVQNVFAHESLYSEFNRALGAAVRALRVGDPLDSATQVAGMISEGAAARVQATVTSALAAGASLIAGGTRERNVHAPTVLGAPPLAHPVFAEEIFGPVASVARFAALPEAIAAINASRFGLQTGLFTNSLHAAHYAFERLEVGGVVVGDVPTTRVDAMPYGGVKDSGVGREGPRFAIEEFTERRLMLLKDAAVLAAGQ